MSFLRMSVQGTIAYGIEPFLEDLFFVSPFFKLFPGDSGGRVGRGGRRRCAFLCRQNLFPIHCILTWVFQE